MTSSHAVTSFPPKWRRFGKPTTPFVHRTNGPGYSATVITVLFHNAPNPPALAMALFNSLAVRWYGFSRRSHAIFCRSSPYLLTRRSRYNLSPEDVCRSRTLAEAASFSRSTGTWMSYRNLLSYQKRTLRARGVNLSATLWPVCRKHCSEERNPVTDLEQLYLPWLPSPLHEMSQDHHGPTVVIPIPSSPLENLSPFLDFWHLLLLHRSVVPRGQRYRTSLELFFRSPLGVQA